MPAINKTDEFSSWIRSHEKGVTGRLGARIDKLRLGLWGDWKPVGGGVKELREDFGPGYRIYVHQQTPDLIIALCGGDKSTQSADMQHAQDLVTQLESVRSGDMALKTTPFDAAEYLDDSESIAAYLSAMADESPALLMEAIGTVARARGMSEIAEASGLSRESLYKSLREDAQPRFDTVSRVLTALGMHLSITPV